MSCAEWSRTSSSTRLRSSSTRLFNRLRRQRIRLNINLLGEAVLGNDESDRRLRGTRELLGRADVDYVSIKVSSVAAQLSMWAFEETVERVVERLTPLYELAATSPSPKFINLDMEEYRDLDLTIAVFMRLLDQPELQKLEAGIVLQAYLPDALGALQGLTAWATERRQRGGAPDQGARREGRQPRDGAGRCDGARLAAGDLLAQGRDRHQLQARAGLGADARSTRMPCGSASPATTSSMSPTPGCSPKQRNVDTRIEFEMLLGMATGQAEVVKRDVGGLLLYTPVVHPAEFDSAISYLVRRLEENASRDNFMSALFELVQQARGVRARVRPVHRRRSTAAAATVPAPNRVQDRAPAVVPGVLTRVRERAGHRSVASPTTGRGGEAPGAQRPFAPGRRPIAAARVRDPTLLDALIESTGKAGDIWGARPSTARARILHDAGDVLAASAADLIEVMASETGKTIAEGDPEVSEATDFAHYYAERALELDRSWPPRALCRRG